MNKNTEKKVKRLLVQNKNGKNDVELYVWHLDYFTEGLVREMKEYINFDELFERRYTINPHPELSKDFLNELKNEKNFGEWMSKESGLARYVRTSDCSDLNTDLLDAFKDEILNYAKSLGEEGYNDYVDFYEDRYDDEMKEWINSFKD